MLYVLSAILLITILILALSVRIRVVWEDSRRTVSLTLGRRSGVVLDFTTERGSLKLAGLPLYRFDIDLEGKPKEEKPTEERPKKKRRRRKGVFSRDRLRVLKELLPKLKSALWRFARGVIKATVIEEARARVIAGFDSPDQTGIAFGYYQAVLGVAPKFVGRVQFVPDWMGPSFTATGRLAVAITLYKLLWRTFILLVQLLSMKSLRMAIRQKKGDRDAK